MVTSNSIRLSILVLTEDSSSSAPDTIRVLIKELLKWMDPHIKTNHIRIEPPEDKELARAVYGTTWKSSNPGDRQKRVSLVRYIATKLMEPNGFVFFHIDGDTSWSKRQTSFNLGEFNSNFQPTVLKLLQMHFANTPPPIAIEKAISKLLLVMPFYSMEAWAYQNTKHAIRISSQRYNGSDIPKFTEWEKNRAAIDEVRKIKTTTHLGSRHNFELASESFPTKDALSAKTSFSAALDNLLQCEELKDALLATHQTVDGH